jgi:predicted membrane protein
MGMMLRRTFWGFILVFIGILAIIQNYTGIELHLWGTFFSLLLIGWGLGILMGSHRSTGGRQVIFDEAHVSASDKQTHYDTIFGRGVYDFRDLKVDKDTDNLEANAIFGESIIKISPNTPMLIKGSSVFGQIKFPDGETAVFSEREYRTKSFKADSPYIRLKASAIFGNLEVIDRSE